METQVEQIKTILIVDDEHANRFFLQALLESQQYNVETATSGMEALKMIDHKTPNLVLLDIMMPDMNGFEVLRLLKQDPKTADIPVIMLTSLGKEENLEQALDMGAIEFLTKPLDENELFAKIKVVLQSNSNTNLLKDQLKLFCSCANEQLNLNRNHSQAFNKFVLSQGSVSDESSFDDNKTYKEYVQYMFKHLVELIYKMFLMDVDLQLEKKEYKLDQFVSIAKVFLSSDIHKKDISIELKDNENIKFSADHLFFEIALLSSIRCMVILIDNDDNIIVDTNTHENEIVLTLYNQSKKLDISSVQQIQSQVDNIELKDAEFLSIEFLIKIITKVAKLHLFEFNIHQTFDKGIAFQFIINN